MPRPARFRTVIIDDVNFSNDPQSIMYGEKAGLAFAPVGIYDFANKLDYTAETDYNGIYDVLMPSTNPISCPTPSGVCANMYRFVANDPGVPGALNPNYNPRFVTHAAGAEGLPGAQTFADLAPTQVGVTVESPATGIAQNVTCPLDATTPQLFTVSRPYVETSTRRSSFTINGLGFGARRAPGRSRSTGPALPTTCWTDTSIDGHRSRRLRRPDRSSCDHGGATVRSTINGLTFHVFGDGYSPNLNEVGPGLGHRTTSPPSSPPSTRAQAAAGDDLVVVYPGEPDLRQPAESTRAAPTTRT